MMKKIFLALALLLAVVACVPTIANAATDTEAQICDYAKKKDKVADAACVIFDNSCVVALKTEKFTTKSDYDTFKEQLRKEIAEKYKLGTVLITRSPKAMHDIEQFAKLSAAERDEAVKNFVENELERGKRPPRPNKEK